MTGTQTLQDFLWTNTVSSCALPSPAAASQSRRAINDGLEDAHESFKILECGDTLAAAWKCSPCLWPGREKTGSKNRWAGRRQVSDETRRRQTCPSPCGEKAGKTTAAAAAAD